MSTDDHISADVCIVGAGIAGLNALFVASRYLKPEQKVVLVDRRSSVGGMWVDTYPYVRLHQPHPLFTAGNIKWTIGREPEYLADRDEVLAHLHHCLGEIGKRIRIDVRLGWTYDGFVEHSNRVEITCHDGDRTLRITADKLITAYGARVIPNEPLELSSDQVHSVSPDYCDMRGAQIKSNNAPVWVIGGGKTGMDTANALLTEFPGREVNLIAGSGTFFTRRDELLPAGRKRWFGGTRPNKVFVEMARRFDGTNETEVRDWFRRTYALQITPDPRNYFFAFLSDAENEFVRAGINEVLTDHCVDVTDDGGSPVLNLRSGDSRPVEPGSWFVNCTGYLNAKDFPYEPVLSAGGRVMSVNSRALTLAFSSFCGYFHAHLFFLDKLATTPLYELDYDELRRKSAGVFPYAVATLLQYNLGLIYDALPAKAFLEWGLNFDRWYPLPRQIAGQVQYRMTYRRHREHYKQTLDTVRERFDVHCGPSLRTAVS
ncbi:FAD-dependent oxidoreductase [Aldersonia kunmingensis]|uniref:FAD-dependent oxidoreductase n=1 Tax=Aldersonia kunmingensis TaxID=408066 RepID=UPI00082FD46E|nr:FAD-dependent oxidoreductase [Aldersonia kunmingensis]